MSPASGKALYLSPIALKDGTTVRSVKDFLKAEIAR